MCILHNIYVLIYIHNTYTCTYNMYSLCIIMYIYIIYALIYITYIFLIHTYVVFSSLNSKVIITQNIIAYRFCLVS